MILTQVKDHLPKMLFLVSRDPQRILELTLTKHRTEIWIMRKMRQGIQKEGTITIKPIYKTHLATIMKMINRRKSSTSNFHKDKILGRS